MGREKLIPSKKKAKKTKPIKKKLTAEKLPLVPLKFHVPDNIISRFATNMTVQILDDEFKINFYEMKPELNFDPNAAPPSEVKADCVASVIVPASKLDSWIDVFKGQVERYNSRSQQGQMQTILP
jgi:hypothetical protein